MDRRETLLAQLARHYPADGAEADDTARVAAFAQAHADPFDRSIRPGHVTASALVTDVTLTRLVLVHHAALDRWIQPGGHAEPTDASGLAVAVREAREETGLDVRVHPAWPRLFDVDVHPIPAAPGVPAHLHFDVRYLVAADPGEPLGSDDDGVRAVRWVDREEALEVGHGVGLARMVAKLARLSPDGPEAPPWTVPSPT